MKNLFLLLCIFTLVSCSITFESTAKYDDVYYKKDKIEVIETNLIYYDYDMFMFHLMLNDYNHHKYSYYHNYSYYHHYQRNHNYGHRNQSYSMNRTKTEKRDPIRNFQDIKRVQREQSPIREQKREEHREMKRVKRDEQQKREIKRENKNPRLNRQFENKPNQQQYDRGVRKYPR